MNYKRGAILEEGFDPAFSVFQMVKDLELIEEFPMPKGFRWR